MTFPTSSKSHLTGWLVRLAGLPASEQLLLKDFPALAGVLNCRSAFRLIHPTKMPRYKLAFYVPVAHAIAVKRAVFATGAGSIGNYKHCAFQVKGEGQFLPMEGANPAIGEQGKEEVVEEYKVEILCADENITRNAVQELKKAHPYEEVAYEVYKVEDF